MPSFSAFLAMFSGTCGDLDRGGQLYLENILKQRKTRHFVYCGGRRSGTYVNMVKIAFQSGENRCLLTHPEA